MTNFEQITIIANQIANDGKKPSVALIKSKLSSPIPLPQIISTLKNWQHEPENCTFTEPEQSPNDSKLSKLNDDNELSEAFINETVTTAINNALVPVHAELAEIKKLLQQLNKNN